MNNYRPIVVQVFFVLVALVFISKLFYLQIINDEYKIKAKDNTVRKVRVYPYRGVILDRKQRPVVVNQPVFDLMVVKKKVSDLDTALFCQLLNLPKEDFIKKMDAIYGLASNKPQVILKQIPLNEYSRFADLFDFSGFYFNPRIVRSYPHAVMANSIGYIAEISKRELDSDTTSYYTQGDYIGKSGIEKTYEDDLRGESGAKYVLVDVKGVEKGAFRNGELNEPSIPGKNLQLSIDVELQKYGERLMAGKVGSIVAIEPKTGEILAIVSSPSYNPNLLVGRDYSSNYVELLRDSLKPLFDRATQAGYPPGSIFKIIQAGIGMQEKLITPTSRTYVDAYPNMGDHAPAGTYDVKKAITISSNWYFAKLYKRMLHQGKVDNRYEDAEINFNIWHDYVYSFGFGHKLGSDISHELGGSIPSDQLYDRIYGDKRWKASTIISNAIGQGELLVVPIQMANLSAVIANKGYYYRPHLIKQIGEKDSIPEKFKERLSCMVDPKYFDIIHDAMEQVVCCGTARRALTKDIAVCGKTGTAENPHGEDHSVFIAFAPKENPKIAISVYVENAGYGGTWAAPISSLMIEKYLKDSTTNKYEENRILEKRFIN